jgi:hypothetical protein
MSTKVLNYNFITSKLVVIVDLDEIKNRLTSFEEKLTEIEKRLKVLQDIEEIKQLQARYLNALMLTDWDAVIECFAENAAVDVAFHKPISGKSTIDKWFREELSKTHVGMEGDFVVHPIITVEGDKAKGIWLLYMMYYYPRTGQSLFWVQGFYENEYVRENGKWKISLMKWRERIGLPGGGPPAELYWGVLGKDKI